MRKIRTIIIHLVGTVAGTRESHTACPGCRDEQPLHWLRRDTAAPAESEVVIDLREPGRPAWLAAAPCDPFCAGCRRNGIDAHPSTI